MSGPSRINVLGLLCSCVSNAALLGGILFGLLDTRPRAVGARAVARPLIVELIPLAGKAEGRSRQGSPAAPAPPVAAPPEPRRAPGAQQIAFVPIRPATLMKEEGDALGAAASTSDSSARAAEFSAYQHRLYEAIARSSRYPAEARRAHLSGVTILAFTLDRAGNVVDSWIQKSSGSEMLDNAALEALERARPLPPLPAGYPARIDFVIELDLSILQQAALNTIG